MLLHKHHADDTEGGQTEVYVLHIAPQDALFLINAISGALANNPESESYSLTLGRVEDLDAEPEPIIQIVGLDEDSAG